MEKMHNESPENIPHYETEVISEITEEEISEIVELDKEIFPADMAVPQEELEASLTSSGVQVVLRLESHKAVGYITSLPQSDAFSIIKQFDPEFTPDDDALYIESIGISKEHRSLANLNSMLSAFVDNARKKEFKKITAHTRVLEGLSDVAQKKFGAKKVRRIENWGGFGEPFDYLEIDL